MDGIIIKGARTHNLKNVDLTLPRGKLTVITGMSGSGKSSLAFDTLYAEGQRRYVESLSTYARQFLDLMPKPDVDSVEGLSPAIAIDQRGVGSNSRSTVGTVTEIADYLRLLFARLGVPYCPDHHLPLRMSSIASIVDTILTDASNSRMMLMAPIAHQKVDDFRDFFSMALAQGFTRFEVDGVVRELHEPVSFNDGQPHDISVVVDRLRITPENRERLADSCETASELGKGRIYFVGMDDGSRHDFSTRYVCPRCDFTVSKLEPKMFSPNSPEGCCPTCQGTGMTDAFDLTKIVTAPPLSLATGAISGWDMRNAKNYKRLKYVAPVLGASLTEPWESLSSEVQNGLLYGTEATRALTPPFGGIVTEMQQLWDSPATSRYLRQGLSAFRSSVTCQACQGLRLRRESLSVYVGDGTVKVTLLELQHLSLTALQQRLGELEFSQTHHSVALRLVEEIRKRLRFLEHVGLGYLTLDRRTDSLSGGESQRIRLAGQIGSGLTGVLYVLDEPSIGLHQRDNDKLIDSLKTLRDLGNTLVVVEHDEDAIRNADYVVDLGPGAGELGGKVMAVGTPQEIIENPASLTGAYLSGKRSIAAPAHRNKPIHGAVHLRNARGHNLKHVDFSLPVGVLTTVTGVSGSGKSSLVIDTLYAGLHRELNGASVVEPLENDGFEHLELLDKVVMVDQTPLGRTPRSNPATYTGLFTQIREVFGNTQMARERGYNAGRFSFNVKGGRCEACQGDGMVKMELQFLPDVFVPCEVCHGRRYNRETLEVKYKGLDIAEVLNLTVREAIGIFDAYPRILRILRALEAVGLGYIRLGQSATTFSGGEAQRIKLATELARPDTGRTLYILDEPTTGLHFEDIAQLMNVLRELVKLGNTVLVIEHNLDVVWGSDWVVDMGPEGGAGGGEILFEGTPEQMLKTRGASVTAPYLRKLKRSVKA